MMRKGSGGPEETHFYRLVDPIHNLRLRITLRKVSSSSAGAVGRSPTKGGTNNNKENQRRPGGSHGEEGGGGGAVYCRSFKWQEKVFGPVELAKYSKLLGDAPHDHHTTTSNLLRRTGGPLAAALRRRSQPLGWEGGQQQHDERGLLSGAEAEYMERFRRMAQRDDDDEGLLMGGQQQQDGSSPKKKGGGKKRRKPLTRDGLLDRSLQDVMLFTYTDKDGDPPCLLHHHQHHAQPAAAAAGPGSSVLLSGSLGPVEPSPLGQALDRLSDRRAGQQQQHQQQQPGGGGQQHLSREAPFKLMHVLAAVDVTRTDGPAAEPTAQQHRHREWSSQHGVRCHEQVLVTIKAYTQGPRGGVVEISPGLSVEEGESEDEGSLFWSDHAIKTAHEQGARVRTYRFRSRLSGSLFEYVVENEASSSSRADLAAVQRQLAEDRLKDWQQVEARRNRVGGGGQPQPQAAGGAGVPSSFSGGGKELLALVEIVSATGLDPGGSWYVEWEAVLPKPWAWKTTQHYSSRSGGAGSRRRSRPQWQAQGSSSSMMMQGAAKERQDDEEGQSDDEEDEEGDGPDDEGRRGGARGRGCTQACRSRCLAPAVGAGGGGLTTPCPVLGAAVLALTVLCLLLGVGRVVWPGLALLLLLLDGGAVLYGRRGAGAGGAGGGLRPFEAHFGQLLSLSCVIGSDDSSEHEQHDSSSSPPAPLHCLRIYFQLSSLHPLSRHRLQGYCFLDLPASPTTSSTGGGGDVVVLQAWRPVAVSVRRRMKDWLLGGGGLLKGGLASCMAMHHAPPPPASANRGGSHLLGLQTESAGQLKVRVRVVVRDLAMAALHQQQQAQPKLVPPPPPAASSSLSSSSAPLGTWRSAALTAAAAGRTASSSSSSSASASSSLLLGGRSLADIVNTVRPGGLSPSPLMPLPPLAGTSSSSRPGLPSLGGRSISGSKDVADVLERIRARRAGAASASPGSEQQQSPGLLLSGSGSRTGLLSPSPALLQAGGGGAFFGGRGATAGAEHKEAGADHGERAPLLREEDEEEDDEEDEAKGGGGGGKGGGEEADGLLGTGQWA